VFEIRLLIEALDSQCLEPEQFTGKGSRNPHIEGSPPTKQGFSGSFGTERAILEASDWLLGARAIFPGRGDGPRAFRGLGFWAGFGDRRPAG